MTHHIGLSGSTILTDPNRFTEMFKGDLEHIEIGEFPDEGSFQS
jgi:hypothetical protein